jgi:glyoxylase-like metal-dependent hydrolase (beta-lactamase superfamily II)
MELYSIETGNLKLDGGAMFGVVPKSIWNKLYPADQNNQINLSMRCLLVINDNYKILIDNGIGNKQNEKFLKHYYLNGDHNLLNSLNQNNINLKDITDVILTHLHFDHCGGSVSWNEDKNGYIPTFPNAQYHISQTQLNLALNPNRREKASFLHENFVPLIEHKKVNTIDNEGFHFPNIELRFFNGHTMGQMLPFIHYKNRTLVYMGDVLALAAHLPLPYIMSYDTQPLISLDEKEKFLNEAYEYKYILFFEHDIFHECITINKTEKGFEIEKSFSLSEL